MEFPKRVLAPIRSILIGLDSIRAAAMSVSADQRSSMTCQSGHRRWKIGGQTHERNAL